MVEEKNVLLKEIELNENLEKCFKLKTWQDYYHYAVTLLVDHFINVEVNDSLIDTIVQFVEYSIIVATPVSNQKFCHSCEDFKGKGRYSKKSWKNKDGICNRCIDLNDRPSVTKKCISCLNVKKKQEFKKSQWREADGVCNFCKLYYSGIIQEKRCAECQNSKEISHFSKDQWKKTGRCSKCIRFISNREKNIALLRHCEDE